MEIETCLAYLAAYGYALQFGQDPDEAVEFFDYQCPPCREVRGNVKGIEDLYKGKIRVVYRNFPLAMHLHAASAAAAAEAARDQGKFDVVHEALLAGKSLDDPEIVLLAHNAGLNQQRFRSAWKHSATLRSRRTGALAKPSV